MLIDWLYLFSAFGGGIFGSAVGAFPAFLLCGVSIVAGGILSMITGDQSFNTLITWGPFLGPHVAFAGGAAGAAYAAKQGKLDSGRNIVKPLAGLKDPFILLVGGFFGVLGLVFAWGASQIPEIKGIPAVNPIALSIAINTMIIRLIFGKTGLLGAIHAGHSRWHPKDPDNGFPWHLSPAVLIILSIGICFPAAYISSTKSETDSILFGISVIALAFLVFGLKVPIIFHLVLAAQLGAAATGNVWWGLTFGILTAFLTEIFACLFLLHGDTHIDPPAMALSVIFTLYPVLAYIGIIQIMGIWSFLITAVVIFIVWMILNRLSRLKTKS